MQIIFTVCFSVCACVFGHVLTHFNKVTVLCMFLSIQITLHVLFTVMVDKKIFPQISFIKKDMICHFNKIDY